MEFLIISGLPESKKENVDIKQNGVVIVKNLENSVCQALIEKVHAKKNFGRKLFCDGIIPLTPEKVQPCAADSPASTVGGSVNFIHPWSTDTDLPTSSFLPVSTVLASSAAIASTVASSPQASTITTVSTGTATLNFPGKPLPHTDPEVSGPFQENILRRNPSQESLPDWNNSGLNWAEHTGERLVRRYSLSLTNRTPPKNSLAADILGAHSNQISMQGAMVNKNLMSSIKDLQEAISDFNSCQSTLDESSASEESCRDLKIPAETTSKKKRKRRQRSEFCREEFLKKQDTKTSPK